MIDRFTKERFEAALPKVPWEVQFSMGEYVYSIPVYIQTKAEKIPTNKRITIRSSIGRDGIAADTGKDSIRHWVEYYNKNRWWPLSKDSKSWTTRVPGWEARLTDSLRRLWRIAVDDSKKRGDHGKVDYAGNGTDGQVNKQRDLAHSGTSNRLLDGYGMQEVLEPKVLGSNRSEECGSGANLPGLFGNFESSAESGARANSNPVDSDKRSEGASNPFDFLGEATDSASIMGARTEQSTSIAGKDDGTSGDAFGFLADNEHDLGRPGQDESRRSLEDSESAGPKLTHSRANVKQLEAIEADIHTPLRVLAPPGSGKTFLLAHRYAHLLSNDVNPNDIVAVTFSRSMADELLARIARENPQIEELLQTDPTADAITQITTIHALCFRILKAEGDKRCVPDRDARIKPWQVKKALEEIINDLWPVILHRPGYKEVEAHIAAAKMEGFDSEHDLALFETTVDKFGNNVGQELHLARRRFDDWCQRNGVILFSDMVYEVDQRLKKDPAFKLRWQNKYKYMMIDEGQDTSGQAMRVLTTLAAPQNNITIVGDTDQLLYRFAGATPEANLYEGFEDRYSNGKMVILDVNYRSTKAIIRAYSNMIRNNYCIESEAGENFDGPYEGKYFKHIQAKPDAQEGTAVTFEMHETPREEGEAIAKHLKQLLDEGREPDHFFIAARTSAQLGYLEGPLVQNGIPYINLNGGSFFSAKHVADVIAYIRLAFDETDSEAFERVYNVASKWNTYPWGKEKGQYCNHRFLGQEFLKACFDGETRTSQYKWRWAAVGKRSSWQNGVRDLEELLFEIQNSLANESVKEAITCVVDNCYAAYLAAAEGIVGGDASDNGKLDDFETLREIAEEFKNDTKAFLDYVEKAKAAAEATRTGDWSGHVVISTIHRLKGLERPVVFGMGLCEGADKNGAPVGLLPHTYSMRPPAIQGVLPMGGMGKIEDERDICYVLVSRAKDECHLTGCRTYRNWTMYPSRFISEMEIEEGVENV